MEKGFLRKGDDGLLELCKNVKASCPNAFDEE